jgi:hypothetical protein
LDGASSLPTRGLIRNDRTRRVLCARLLRSRELRSIFCSARFGGFDMLLPQKQRQKRRCHDGYGYVGNRAKSPSGDEYPPSSPAVPLRQSGPRLPRQGLAGDKGAGGARGRSRARPSTPNRAYGFRHNSEVTAGGASGGRSLLRVLGAAIPECSRSATESAIQCNARAQQWRPMPPRLEHRDQPSRLFLNDN